MTALFSFFTNSSSKCKALLATVQEGVNTRSRIYNKEWIVSFSGSSEDSALAKADQEAVADFDAAVERLLDWHRQFEETKAISDVGTDSFSVTYVVRVWRDKVSKIIYRSSRVQEFAGRTSFRRLASPMDWQQVSIASVESEVQGLYKVDDVSSKAKGTKEFSNQERVKRRAQDKIKMQAAILGANLLYMAQMRSEGTKVNFWTGGAGTSAETSLFSVAYSSQMPRLSTVSELMKDNGEFAVAEEISLTNNDTNFSRSSTAKTLTIDRIYDDSELVMIEGTLSKSKETLFRVTFCNDHDFYIAYKTRRGFFSYKVTVQ